MTTYEGRPKPVTMDDIGRLAGVHSRTVADALKNRGRVAVATREKILRIARELEYVPNAAARALATGRTGTVAVLSGSLNESYFANMVHMLEIHLTAHRHEILLLHTRREAKDLVQAAQTSLVDGVIVLGFSHLTNEFLRSNRVQPCVLIDTYSPDFVDHITLDLRPAVEKALQFMLAAGRQRIAYVANNRDAEAHVEVRMATYLEAIKAADRAPEIIDVNTQISPRERIAAIKAYFKDKGCPGALLCQNDETAIHVYRAAVEMGFRLPDDLLLVGCDGLPYMEFFEPQLSTIALPAEEICFTAVQFLQQRMAQPDLPLQQKTVQGHLVVRKSLVAD